MSYIMQFSVVFPYTSVESIYEILAHSGLHKHCSMCFSFTRCLKEGDHCEFVQCSCDAVLHSCKLELHEKLCPNALVKCINSEFGCDQKLLRRNLGSHLIVCPANILTCKAEWNRWPLYASERRKHIPFKLINPLAQEGQLDYDLAQRDQRMLDTLNRIPRRTKLCLRNHLTRRFPAVPVPNVSSLSLNQNYVVEGKPVTSGDYDESDDEVDHGILNKRQRRLEREQKERWEKDLEVRLKGQIIPPKYWEFPDLEKGNLHKHCAYCININCPRVFELRDSYEDMACQLVSCREDCGARFHNCKSSEHMLICPNYEPDDDCDWMFKGMIAGKIGFFGPKKRLKKSGTTKTVKSLPAKPVERVWKDYNPKVQSQKPTRPGVIPKPPSMPKNLFVPCRLDIRLDTITKHQTKPRSMYTFICAQDFKRCEYAWHYQNIHSEIHGGLSNWVEQRCPLATYGCGFSARRLFPAEKNSTIVYNTTNESFGVTLLPTKTAKTSHKMSFMQLPFEIINEILEMLDPYSLFNVSLTCRQLRTMCCSLVDTKGCVALQWEQSKTIDGRVCWKVAYKRWFYSSAIHPIVRWRFSSKEGAVSEHMKTCPYNLKSPHKPVDEVVISWKKFMPSLKEKLQQRAEQNPRR